MKERHIKLLWKNLNNFAMNRIIEESICQMKLRLDGWKVNIFLKRALSLLSIFHLTTKRISRGRTHWKMAASISVIYRLVSLFLQHFSRPCWTGLFGCIKLFLQYCSHQYWMGSINLLSFFSALSLLPINTATSEKFPEPWFKPRAAGLWSANATEVLCRHPPWITEIWRSRGYGGDYVNLTCITNL